jgi:large subunit ribosomal protein L3
MTPGRTLPNLKMPGQYGNETVSVQNLKIARVDAEKHLLLIEGAVPGTKNGLVLVRHAVKSKVRKKR